MSRPKITPEQVRERQAWTLDRKLIHFAEIYVDFYQDTNGQVYGSFSGGKDSQVGLDIIDKIHSGEFAHLLPVGMAAWIQIKPAPPRVHCNTGLEFTEVTELVRARRDVVILKPKMGFTRVIKEVGVAVGSKKVAMQVQRIKQHIADGYPAKTKATYDLYMTGVKRDGTISTKSKLSERWKTLLTAPFPTSDQCCDIFKKEPFRRYEAETGRSPIVFTTVEESNTRFESYLKTGCTSFEKGKGMCRPYSIFTEADTWEYHDRYGLRFAEVYYERTQPVKQLDGSYVTRTLPAESRTGCTFCLFGMHLEPKHKPNRMQRLAMSHPLEYHIVINKCGLGNVLDYLNIPYKPVSPKRTYCQLNLFAQP